jgi:hypothetical protein
MTVTRRKLLWATLLQSISGAVAKSFMPDQLLDQISDDDFVVLRWAPAALTIFDLDVLATPLNGHLCERDRPRPIALDLICQYA